TADDGLGLADGVRCAQRARGDLRTVVAAGHTGRHHGPDRRLRDRRGYRVDRRCLQAARVSASVGASLEVDMGTMIPLGDASRRPLHRSVVTASIILVNAIVFIMELQGGEPFVMKWSVVAAFMCRFLFSCPRDQIRSWLVIFVFVRVTFVPAALLIGVLFVLQLVSRGLVAAAAQTGGVAYVAHVGGLVFGALAARLFEDP